MNKDPLSFISLLLRPIRPSRYDISRDRAREQERKRRATDKAKAEARERMRKLREKK